jgi:hypothetical protein
MGNQHGTEIPDLVPVSRLRQRIDLIVQSGGPTAVTALLKLDQSAVRSRPTDKWSRLAVCLVFGIGLIFGIARIPPSIVAILSALLLGLAGYLLIAIIFPFHDRAFADEKSEVRAMIKLALSQIDRTSDLRSLRLDNKEKSAIVKLYGQEEMPTQLRQALVNETRTYTQPDV